MTNEKITYLIITTLIAIALAVAILHGGDNCKKTEYALADCHNSLENKGQHLERCVKDLKNYKCPETVTIRNFKDFCTHPNTKEVVVGLKKMEGIINIQCLDGDLNKLEEIQFNLSSRHR